MWPAPKASSSRTSIRTSSPSRAIAAAGSSGCGGTGSSGCGGTGSGVAFSGAASGSGTASGLVAAPGSGTAPGFTGSSRDDRELAAVPGGDRPAVRALARVAQERADAVRDLGVDDVLHAACRHLDLGVREMHGR